MRPFATGIGVHLGAGLISSSSSERKRERKRERERERDYLRAIEAIGAERRSQRPRGLAQGVAQQGI